MNAYPAPSSRAIVHLEKRNYAELLGNTELWPYLDGLVQGLEREICGFTGGPRIKPELKEWKPSGIVDYITENWEGLPGRSRARLRRAVISARNAFLSYAKESTPETLKLGSEYPTWLHSMLVAREGVDCLARRDISHIGKEVQVMIDALHDVDEDTEQSATDVLADVESLHKNNRVPDFPGDDWEVYTHIIPAAVGIVTRKPGTWYIGSLRSKRRDEEIDKTIKFLAMTAKQHDRSWNGAHSYPFTKPAKRAKELLAKGPWVFDYGGRAFLKEQRAQEGNGESPIDQVVNKWISPESRYASLRSGVQRAITSTYFGLRHWIQETLNELVDDVGAEETKQIRDRLREEIAHDIERGVFDSLGKPPTTNYLPGFQDRNFYVSETLCLLEPNVADLRKAWKELQANDPQEAEKYLTNHYHTKLTPEGEAYRLSKGMSEPEARFIKTRVRDLGIPAFLRTGTGNAWYTIAEEIDSRRRVNEEILNQDPEKRLDILMTWHIATARYALDQDFTLFHNRVK